MIEMDISLFVQKLHKQNINNTKVPPVYVSCRKTLDVCSTFPKSQNNIQTLSGQHDQERHFTSSFAYLNLKCGIGP